MMSQKSANALFLGSVLLYVTLLIQMCMYGIGAVFHVRVGLNFFQICQSVILSFGVPYIATVLNALIVYTACLTVWKLSKQFVLSQRMYIRFLLLKDKTLTRDIVRRTGTDTHGLLVIRSDELVCLTMGFVHPRVVVSTALLQLLDEGELRAVLYHEQHHQRNRDPLRILLLDLFAAAMWYVPALHHIKRKYRILAELLSDNYATREMGSAMSLGSALLKWIKHSPTNSLSFSYVSFAHTALHERIERLIDPDRTIAISFPISIFVVSILSLVLLFSLFSLFLM